MIPTSLSHLADLAAKVLAADSATPHDGHATALASDAFHAAANPTAILSLIAEVRRLRAGLAEACALALDCATESWPGDPELARIAELAKLGEGE